MATVMIMPVHIPVSKTSPMTPQPDSTDNSGAKHAIFKCLIIMRARTKVLTLQTVPSQEAQPAQQRSGRPPQSLAMVARISAVSMLKKKEARDISSLQ